MAKIWDAIKRAGVWIRRIFEDPNGVPSSKRVQSFVLLAFALLIAVTVKDVGMAAVFLGAALGLQGVTAFQK